VSRQRTRFPYEWQIALSGAVLLGLSVVLPSAPFSGALALWARWIGKPLLQWRIFGTTNELASSFLPLIGAFALAYALRATSAPFAETRPRARLLACIGASLMLVLGLLVTADIATKIGLPLEIAQVAVSCVTGIVLAALAVSLRNAGGHTFAARLAIVGLLISGILIASFALLPVGVLALLVTYIGLAFSLARRDTRTGTTQQRPSPH